MRLLSATALALPALLAACADTALVGAGSDPRPGFAFLSSKSRQATGASPTWTQNSAELAANEARVKALIAGKTIGPDTAVQVALMNNRGLQAAFADLGFAAADVWETGLGPNPALAVGISGIGEVGIADTFEAVIVGSLLDLATRKQRGALAMTDFQIAQLEVLAATLALAWETRLAWIDAVAAFEAAALVGRAQGTADAASELAAELGRTGALSASDQAREYAFTAALAAERAEARLEARLAKERLARLMGLSGPEATFYVPDRLPALPGRRPGRANVERMALEHRVDIAAGRLALDRVAREYRLDGQTRMISDIALAAGVEVERTDGDAGRETETTPVVEIGFEIPLYDTTALKGRRGQMAYLHAANALAQTAIDARAEARAAHAAVEGRYDIARHWRDQVLPLRRTIDEEALKSYNGMLTSTFELIADAREGLEAELGAAEAKADYWRAEVAVSAAMWGGAAEGDTE